MTDTNDTPDAELAETNDADDQDTPDTESSSEPDRTTIRTGRNFEEEYRLSADEVGAFLVDLGEQLQDSDDLRLVTDEWELPFAFGEPVELEIEYEGVDEPELEIELEIPGRTDETAPDVE
jgi:amphi-Trp domain-containing protein